MTSYTLADTLRVLFAFVLFAPCLVFPGYVIGTASDALQFRLRSVAERLLIAVPLSIAISPLLIYLTGLLSMQLTWAILGVTGVAFVALLARDLRLGIWHDVASNVGSDIPTQFPIRSFLCYSACWLAAGLFSLLDLQWGDRLYIPTTSWDYMVRVGFTDSITRTGVAPANPFFFSGQTFPLRYHYFWMLPASIVDQLGGASVTPAQATLAGTLWAGLGLMALVVLFVSYFRDGERPPSARRARIGIMLLTVTGLDIIPMLFFLLMFNNVRYTVDSWNELIAGWLSSVLWVPHAVAAVVGCLTGFLVMWTGASRTARVRRNSAIVAGAAFACTAGLSIYVAFVFGAAMCVYGSIALWKRWRGDVIALAWAAVAALVLALPYLSRLAKAVASNGGPFVTLTVRKFTIPEMMLGALKAPAFMTYVVDFLLVPLNYGLELGLLFLVGVIHARRLFRRKKPMTRREWAEVALIATPILICTFLRSGVIRQNDLGWRAFLVPQFMLLLWSIDYVRIAARFNVISGRTGSPLMRFSSVAILLLGLGVASTVYGLLTSRVFMPALDAGWLRREGAWFATPDLKIGVRMRADRDAAEWIRTHVPRDAVMLENPQAEDPWTGLYANHQTVAYNLSCAAAFGGTDEACQRVLADVLPLFEKSTLAHLDIESVCQRYSIRAVFVKDLDPVWQDAHSWMWERKPEYANDYARVYQCGP